MQLFSETNMSASLRDYLKTIRQYDLITKDDEIILGIRIQRMLALTGTFDRANYYDISVYNNNERAIIREGLKSFLKLFYANLRIVVTVARKYEHKSAFMDIESLIQFGNMGLIRAIETFDPYRNIKFITYAFPWIRQFINRGITNNGRAIRLPIHISDKLDKIKLERNKYIMRHGVEPSFNDICDLANLTDVDARHVLDSNRAMVSLNSHTNDDRDSELGDTSVDDSEDLYENLLKTELVTSVRTRLESCNLSDTDMKIICSTFGIGTAQKTIAKLASELKLKKVDLEKRRDEILEILKNHMGDLQLMIHE
jgi:RNA polymerase nonessential primary-like sigma factor